MSAIDEAVERAADPAAAALAVQRITDAHPEAAPRLASGGHPLQAVVAVAAASRSLTNLLVADPAALDVLEDLDRRPPPAAGDAAGLAAWKRRELLRIAARDLLGAAPLEEVGAGLAALADDVFTAALGLVGANELAVVAMGKWGAQELNYASDVDVLFAGGDDPRPVMQLAGTCFRVDANLRPEGRDGPLVRSLASYEAYWDRWAEPWEFQALLKARPVAGPAALTDGFQQAVAERLWGRSFGGDELRSLRAMKARSEDLIARRQLGERELKHGPGGIRDIEFSIQLLQLVHGRHDPALRAPATLRALDELAAAGYVDADDAATLAAAYRFLRTVEHRLQLVDEQQVHTVPADPTARGRLARVLGYRDTPDAGAREQFDSELRRLQASVRSIHERLYFRPLLEAFAGVAGGMRPDAAEERLAAFGFADADRTRVALRELTRGLTRSSRLMQQLLPLLLQWLTDAPDPDLGLLGLRTLASGEHRTARLVTAFRESPEAARRLCLIAGTSALLTRTLERHPDLIADLGDDTKLAPRDRGAVTARIEATVGWRGSSGEQQTALLRVKDREILRIGAADILGAIDVAAAGAALTALAEGVLDAAMSLAPSPVPMAVIGMGRLGGGELSYASDLDVLLVHGGSSSTDAAAAEAAAEELVRAVKGQTPASRIWLLDAGLRPEGRQGPLARSLDGYAAYYQRWAQTWERQALLRARFVAGDTEVGRRFLDLVAPLIGAGLSDDERREIRRLKARIEKERIPPGEDPQFHLKLGRGSLSDVEWTAQLLQLEHNVAAAGTLSALDRLVDAGVLDAGDRDVLADAYRFCERARNRWFLIRGQPHDALPTQAGQLARLAISLGTTPADLREDYRRVTRRARQVMERLFYGQP